MLLTIQFFCSANCFCVESLTVDLVVLLTLQFLPHYELLSAMGLVVFWTRYYYLFWIHRHRSRKHPESFDMLKAKHIEYLLKLSDELEAVMDHLGLIPVSNNGLILCDKMSNHYFLSWNFSAENFSDCWPYSLYFHLILKLDVRWLQNVRDNLMGSSELALEVGSKFQWSLGLGDLVAVIQFREDSRVLTLNWSASRSSLIHFHADSPLPGILSLSVPSASEPTIDPQPLELSETLIFWNII